MASSRNLFAIRRATDGQYYFYLRGLNSEIIATSEMYATKQSAHDGIAAVKAAAPSAPIVDMTDKK